jgi:hypothetical protein
MLGVLVSVLIGAVITIALLLVTRQRLTRQFSDVQRRLLQAERALVDLKAWREASTTEVQLERLHAGLVRMQENIARRYGALLPLARELGERPASEQRFLSEFQQRGLEQWAAALGMPMESDEISRWTRAIALAEAGGAVELPIPTVDLLALAIALAGVAADGREIAVGGDSMAGVAALLRVALPGTFGATGFRPASTEGDVPAALLLDDSFSGNLDAILDRTAPGSRLVFRGVEREMSGFVHEATEWGVAVYRRREDSR